MLVNIAEKKIIYLPVECIFNCTSVSELVMIIICQIHPKLVIQIYAFNDNISFLRNFLHRNLDYLNEVFP